MQCAPIEPANRDNKTIEDLYDGDIGKLIPILDPIVHNTFNLIIALSLINNLKDNHRKAKMDGKAAQK